MKRLSYLASFAVVAMMVMSAGGTVMGNDYSQVYDQLKENSLSASQAAARVKGAGGEAKIGLIAPVPCPDPGQPPLCMGVKIWGQLVDPLGNPGPCVNLQKHKWQRSERFYLWLEAAVPVQLSLFQNYPEGRPASRQVSPDPAFPQTFATIPAGQPYRFPALIQMDDDLRDELVSIVVVRADVPVLPTATAPAPVSATAVATAVVNANGLPAGTRVTVNAAGHAAVTTAPADPAPAVGAASANALTSFAAATGPNGTLKGTDAQNAMQFFGEINAQARKDPERMKLRLVAAPPATAPPTSTSPVDVELLMMGPGKVAQIELTFHKD